MSARSPEQSRITPHVLFIDNQGSATASLVDEFAKRDCPTVVCRNDTPVEALLQMLDDMPKPRLLVISSGPGTPQTAGCGLALVQRVPEAVPIFGVCLGYQTIVAALGGTVMRSPDIAQGKASRILVHGDAPFFRGLGKEFVAGRYHALAAYPDDRLFATLASLGDIPMAAAHRTRPAFGVLFHPESILTPCGGRIIENVISWAVDTGGGSAA
ncbi:MAG: gamma-glutamyl-gamma-aminobutyrate hydrolase family protein [Proteobacteria bacterium]|nr:gamma-glutamyl-gamma-aminobutyrate hydrolase family protein [Pseudomonadota bacterium]